MVAAYVPCSIKQLPPDLAIRAARQAIGINPVNAPNQAHGTGGVRTPENLALLTGKYWGAAGVRLGVQFMDTNDASLQARILSHMNAWGQYCNATFLLASRGEVRITRVPSKGYWSYLGPDILLVPADRATMNLDGFMMSTNESEYKRVIRHETGHTLGFPHEHQRAEIVDRIDPVRAKNYFNTYDGWDEAMVIVNVLTALDPTSIRVLEAADTRSIMCYGLPGGIMRDGVAVPGGLDIDAIDGRLAAAVYPGPANPPPPPPNPVFDTGVYGADGGMWWFTAAGQRIDRKPFPASFQGTIKVAGNRNHTAAVCGRGGGPQLVCYEVETGRQTCSIFVPGVAQSFRDGLDLIMHDPWPWVRVTAEAPGGSIMVDVDPATGQVTWGPIEAAPNTRRGLGFAFRLPPR